MLGNDRALDEFISRCEDEPRLGLRGASSEDVLDLLRWRNDAHTRSMSRNGERIDEARHTSWFNQALKDPQRILLVAVLSHVKVGMVRFDQRSPERWEISIMLAPEARGKGRGKQVLGMSLSHFFSAHDGVTLLAEVKAINAPSRALFESAGFVCAANDGDLMQYVLNRP